MLVSDLIFSVLSSVITFVLTGLLQIPISLLSQVFGV